MYPNVIILKYIHVYYTVELWKEKSYQSRKPTYSPTHYILRCQY